MRVAGVLRGTLAWSGAACRAVRATRLARRAAAPALLSWRAAPVVPEAAHAVCAAGFADAGAGGVAAEGVAATCSRAAVARQALAAGSAGNAEADARILAVTGTITLSSHSGRDVFAGDAYAGEARAALLLSGAAGAKGGAQVGGDVRRIADADRVARRAVDGRAASVVAGAEVAVTEARTRLTHAATGALAAAPVDAAVATAVGVAGTGGSVRQGRLHAAAIRGAALAVRAGGLAADFAAPLERRTALA